MSTKNTQQTQSPEARLHDMLSGVLLSRMVAQAAQLGLADYLADGPCHHVKLAVELSVSSDALYRLLRGLASHGVFAELESDPGVFESTPVADLLRTNHPGSQRSWAMLHDAEWMWRAVAHLPHSVQTGEPAFHDLFGMNTFRYFAEKPESGEAFFAAMNQVTETILPALLDAYDFSPFHHVIDIGGGLGSLVAAVLHNQPHLSGTLYDQPYMQEPARKYLAERGLADRCNVVSGDFFESVPEGGDLHLLKWIIHDWSDEQAVNILKNCRKAIAPEGRLLLVEQVIADGNIRCPGKMMDIMMLLMEEGRERREVEFASLFEAADFHLNRLIPLLGPWYAIEAVPV